MFFKLYRQVVFHKVMIVDSSKFLNREHIRVSGLDELHSVEFSWLVCVYSFLWGNCGSYQWICWSEGLYKRTQMLLVSHKCAGAPWNCLLELFLGEELAETMVSEAPRFPELSLGAGHLMPVPIPWWSASRASGKKG